MTLTAIFGRIKPYFTGNERTKRYHVGSGLSANCQVREIHAHTFFDSLREIKRAGRFSVCYWCWRALNSR